jgi:hypothetical protein
MSLGALGYVAYGVEATEGTLASSIDKFLPASSFAFDETNDYIVPNQIRGVRDPGISLAAPYAVSGSVDLELIPNSIAYLLKSAFHADVAAAFGSGAYTYTFTPTTEPTTLATLSFESSAANDVLLMQYLGVRANTLDIKGAYGEIVTATVGLEGLARQKKSVQTGLTKSFSTAANGLIPFHFSGAKVQIGDAGSSVSDLLTVKDFSFSVNNNFERIGTLRQTRAYKRMTAGMRDVKLALTLDFNTAAESVTPIVDRLLNEQAVKVVIVLDGGYLAGTSGAKHNLTITIPYARINSSSMPLNAADHLSQSLEFTVTRPDLSLNAFDAVLTTNEKVGTAGTGTSWNW